jgi:hypothetical protein
MELFSRGNQMPQYMCAPQTNVYTQRHHRSYFYWFANNPFYTFLTFCVGFICGALAIISTYDNHYVWGIINNNLHTLALLSILTRLLAQFLLSYYLLILLLVFLAFCVYLLKAFDTINRRPNIVFVRDD